MSKTVPQKNYNAILKERTKDVEQWVGLSEDSEVSFIVKRAIPLEEQLRIVSEIMFRSFEEEEFYPSVFDVSFVVEIGKAFTNLPINENSIKAYDELNQMDILTILDGVTNQHRKIYSIARETVEEKKRMLAHENSIQGLLKKLADALVSVIESLDTGKLASMVDGLKDLNPDILKIPNIANYLQALSDSKDGK